MEIAERKSSSMKLSEVDKSKLIQLGARKPPHSMEAEMAVLGAMTLSRKAVNTAIEVLSEDSFYSENHKTIFSVLISMYERNIDIDVITLANELMRVGEFEKIGGAYYLAEVNNKTPTAANIEQYALIVQEKYLKRSLIEVAGNIIAKGYDDTVDALEEIDRAESEIFKLAETRFSKSYKKINQLTMDAYQAIERMREQDNNSITGVPSGLRELDKILSGFQRSDLVILAARPSMGKTALALSIARNAAVQYKRPTAVFSIEMAASQLVMRLISSEAKVNQGKLKTGSISDEENRRVIDALGVLNSAPIFIDDTPMLQVMELRAKCRRLRAEHKIELIIIDYLQLLHAGNKESREREISVISQTLKQIAKELDVAVVALAQLNRSVESRNDKKPMLSDLRESGSIEQDADVVMFVHRPEYYGIDKYDDAPDIPVEGTAELIIGKHRNGATGSVKVAFQKEFTRFENLQIGYEAPPNMPASADRDNPGF